MGRDHRALGLIPDDRERFGALSTSTPVSLSFPMCKWGKEGPPCEDLGEVCGTNQRRCKHSGTQERPRRGGRPSGTLEGEC